MTKTLSILSLCLALLCAAAWTSSPALTADSWRPTRAADLALKAPVVEKDADALFLGGSRQ